MSLILDALSRAEREKREQANSAPSILSQELAAPEPEKNARVTVWSVGVAVAVLALAAASLIYFLSEDTPLPIVSGNVDSSTGSRSEQGQRQAIAYTAADEGGAAVEQAVWDSQASAASAIESKPDLEIESNIDQEQSAEAVAALYAMSSKDVAEAASEAIESAANEVESTADKISAQQSAAEELIDIERVLREMRAKANPGTLVPHPAPLLEDLTKQFRDRVPTLMYSSHDFNSAGRSSVVINGETLTLTQRSRGVEVREILADSVILRFEGTDFRLKSLNSWVNL